MRKTYISRVKSCKALREIRNYERPRTVVFGRNQTLGVKLCHHRWDDFDICPKAEKAREDAVNRARQRIFDIVEANFDETMSGNILFITLTYGEKQLSPEVALKDFKEFRRKLSYDFFKNRSALKFVATMERQKKRGAREGNEGTVHFHMIAELPTSSFLERFRGRRIRQLWGHGHVDVREANRTLHGEIVEKLPAYIAKYLGKDNIHSFGKNMFLSSRNLVRPTVHYSDSTTQPPFGILKEIVKGITPNGKFTFYKYKVI